MTEDVFYPAHPPRKETTEYKAAHHQLVVLEDRPCLVCGVKNSTLADVEKNPWKAKAVKTHHHHIEWALAEAVDLEKFNARIVHAYRARVGHDPKYDKDFTQDEMLAWVDHDFDNLWCLCDIHHRHKLVGIHAITGPIWGVQDLLRSDFKYTPVTPI